MPNFVSTIRLNKLPVTGLVPETSGSAPASPVFGQLWTDSSITPKLVKIWDGSTWAPANIYKGVTSTSYTAGDDARLSDQRVPVDGSVTGGPAGTGVKIAPGTITDINVATANKDGVAGTASLRTIGLGSQQAMSGSTNLATIAEPTANVNMASYRITGLGAPTLGSDAARLSDVQASSAGIDLQPSVRVASTGNVSVATGLVSGTVLNGVTLAIGNRVLLKNQSTASENGTYVVPASGAASRASDGISPNTFWFIEEGTVGSDTQWMVTTNGSITVGTTALTIAQFGAPTIVTGTANRVTVTSNTVDIASTYVGQASITTLGTVSTGVWNGTEIAVPNGGTGAITPAGARANLNTPQRGYAETLGIVTAGTPLVITHSLNTQDVIAQVRDASNNEYVYLDIMNASVNTVTVTSGVSYAAAALKVVVIPIL